GTSLGICFATDSESVSDEENDADFGRMTTLGPKERNSVVRRRLASVWRLRRAAETAAPAERASRMTKRRPRLAKRKRRTRRRNRERLAVERLGMGALLRNGRARI